MEVCLSYSIPGSSHELVKGLVANLCLQCESIDFQSIPHWLRWTVKGAVGCFATAG